MGPGGHPGLDVLRMCVIHSLLPWRNTLAVRPTPFVLFRIIPHHTAIGSNLFFFFLGNTIKALKLSWRFRERESALLCPNGFRYAKV
jgi:hypothetical protein